MPDKIRFHCPECQTMVAAPPTAAGKSARCPGCTAVVKIPASPVQTNTAGAPPVIQDTGLISNDLFGDGNFQVETGANPLQPGPAMQFNAPPLHNNLAAVPNGLSPQPSQPTGSTFTSRKTLIIIASALGVVLLLVLILFFLPSSGPSLSEVDRFAKDILYAYKDNDPDVFLDLVPDESFHEDFRTSFNDMRREEARRWGFSWRDVDFRTAEYELETEDDSETIPVLRIAFTVPDDEGDFELILHQLIKINHRWRISGSPYGVVRNKLPLPLPNVAKVNGQVIYEGSPLSDATITFHPYEDNLPGGSSRSASGTTDNDGKFSLKLEWAGYDSLPVRIPGAHPGTYSVTATKLTKTDYPQVTGPPPPDTEENAGINNQYFEKIVGTTENPDMVVSDISEKGLINEKFRFAFTTPLRAVEVIAGENNFTIDLNADGSGTVR